MWRDSVELLGWTLLHFVWQGLVVGLIAAVVLAAMRRCSANVRYLTGVVALTAMSVLPLVTFGWLHEPPSSTVESPIVMWKSYVEVPDPTSETGTTMAERFGIDFENPPPPDAIPIRLEPASESDQASLPFGLDRWSWQPALPWIVSVWLAGVVVLSLRLLLGWLSTQRLRRRSSKPADERWQELLRRLAERLRVTRSVQLVESALVEVPAVIGWLRPVILLPATAMTGLTTEQLEALLAHELAHVRRHDYLVNLLQTIVETLLFYHPAVWWLSHRIRIEREHCCDDLAASISGDRLSYAKALVAMEELRAPKIGLALSARGGSLLARVARLLGATEPQRLPSGWFAWLLVIGALTAGAFGAGLLTPPDKPTEGLPKSDDGNSQTINTRPAESEDEKAVAKLELVFFQDRSRRELPALVIGNGKETFVVTTGPATVVPDGTPHAIDGAFLKMDGKPAIPVKYDRRSTSAFFVYRAASEFSGFRLKHPVAVNVGDSLSAIGFHGPNGWRVTPAAATVTALGCERDFRLKDRNVHHRFTGLIEVNRALPEGTPLFKDGRLVGMTLLGARFIGGESARSYAAPADQISDMLRAEREVAEAEWSEEQNGLRTRLTLLSEEPIIGRLVVKVEVRNVGVTERTWRWHPREAARYFHIIGPDGKDVEDLTELARSQMGRPNVVRPTQIKPGETTVLLELYDLAGRFLLAKPGQYEIRFGRTADGELAGKFKNDGDEIVPIPESSRLKFQLGEGELPEIQSLALRLRKVVPVGWGVGLPDPDEFRSIRTDSAHTGLLFDPLINGKHGELLVLGFFIEGASLKKFDEITFTDLGPTKLGHAHLVAARPVKTAWPNYVDQIHAQLPPEDKVDAGKPVTTAPLKTDGRTQKPAEDRVRFVGRVRLKTEKPLPDLEKVELPPGKILDGSLVFSKDGGLANVFVYLPKPTFKIEEPASDKPPKPFVLIAEDGVFWPHAAFVRTGRPVMFENRQKEPLNFRMEPLRNVSFNVLVKTQDRVKVQPFRTSESFPFAIKSDVQPWMQTHLLTLDHPFAAITDEKGGFAIDGLPAGQHEFRVWHERVGYLEKSLVVTIQPGEESRTDLEYKPDQLKLDEAAIQAWGNRLIDATRNPQPRAIRLPPPPKVDEDVKPVSSGGAEKGAAKADQTPAEGKDAGLTSQIQADALKPAIDRGAEYLKTRQAESGLWPEQLGPVYDGGVSSLCLLALLQSGVKPDEPLVQKALASLRKIKPDKTYTVALQTMVFCAASPKENAELIRQNVDWIEQAQVKNGQSRGGWHYQSQQTEGSDRSNSRFAVMGLHAAKKAGFEVQPETWQRVSDYWALSLNDQKGWGYQPGTVPTISMTLAGVASLATANRYLPQDAQTSVREDAIRQAAAYLELAIPQQRTGVSIAAMTYTAQCLERAGHLSGRTHFGKLDWKADLTKKLLDAQRANGSWIDSGAGGNNELIATSLALLSLTGQPERREPPNAEPVKK